jgi:hypothetical protein
MRVSRLQNALTRLGDAMREVNAAIEQMRKEHDPLASHISFHVALPEHVRHEEPQTAHLQISCEHLCR